MTVGQGMGVLLLGMHIPDGFLSLPVTLVTGILAGALVLVALKLTERAYADKLVPLMGVSAAFIFAAQMVNFPVLGGTSGHLLGGTLAGILLGPWAGTLAMVVVFMVQSLLFQDGGLTALGANILNMGLIGTLIGYYLYRTIRFTLGDKEWWAMAVATGVASWLSVVLASLAASVELAGSGTVPLAVVLPAMVGVHLLIGLGEAILTVSVVNFLWRTRPDLLFDPPTEQGGWITQDKNWVLPALGTTLAVAIFLSPFASQDPDGLMRVAQDQGFQRTETPSWAKQLPFYQLFEGYTLRGITVPGVAKAAAGLGGSIVVLAGAWSFGSWVRKRSVN